MVTSMENFHPLHQKPSHADAPNWKHHCAEFAQDCDKLGAQEIALNCVHVRIFADHFSNFENFVELLLVTYLII